MILLEIVIVDIKIDAILIFFVHKTIFYIDEEWIWNKGIILNKVNRKFIKKTDNKP